MSKNQPSRPFQATKKLNLVFPTVDPRPSGYRCRDKIESNLQSQMYVERTPWLEESPLPRDQKSNASQLGVNRDFRQFFIAAPPFRKCTRLRHSRVAKICFVCRRRRKFAPPSTNEDSLVVSTKCDRNCVRVSVITLAAGNYETKSR
jgi:hypothetical protein